MDYIDSIWKYFASVKLSVVLLLSLAATSIIGTLIPQNESPEAYFQAYGEFVYRIFDVFDFFDMYHSWWFQLLIVLLTANIVVCSIDRLSATWKIVFMKHPIFKLERFRNHADKENFEDDRPPEALQDIYGRYVSRSFGYARTDPTPKGFTIFAEKWRWTRLGVYAVHLSIVLLLVGGLIGSIFGFDGYVNIAEGEKVGSIRLRGAGGSKALDFEILCEDFDVSFYDSGMPKEFRSSLTILEQGRAVVKKDIIVNDPLRYKGINMFQSSYGSLPPKDVVLKFTSQKTGKVYEENAVVGRPVDVPETGGTLVLRDYAGSYNFRGQPIGEVFIGVLRAEGGSAIQVLLPVRFPDFDRMMRKDDVAVAVSGYAARYYTGLQVTKDPGVWVVYAGFIMLIAGCYITFFMSHQRLCIDVVKKGKKSRVMVAGTANKNKLSVPKRLQRIAEKLMNM